MEMARPEKVAVVKNIKENIRKSSSIFLTDYAGLNVEKMSELRRELRKKEVTYLIAKNTLARIAVEEEGLSVISPYLRGPVAIAFGMDDPNVPAKIFYENLKKQDKPVVKCFYADGTLYETEADLKTFAMLPSREELLSRIVAAVQSPLTGLISSIEAPIRELVSVIDALVKAKQK
jgi:large subunit ribosomal protein L10